MSKLGLSTVVTAGALTLAVAASSADAQNYRNLRGEIKVDGSSTVYPITEAAAEEFSKVAPDVQVTVGISGTGGGFKRFTIGETDISDASRPIKDKEYKVAQDYGIEFIELPVAYDGLTIVVNTENDWVDSLTVDDLKKIFLADSAAKRWSDVRAGWPDEPIRIYAPGTDSGTFDYFKEVVAADGGAIRSDMSVSEDDNVLVRGVSGDRGSIGFFGAAYYFENKDKLRSVPVVNPETGATVSPTPEAIESGDYAPFSRPLFIYVSKASARRPDVKAFVTFYLQHAGKLAEEVGYVRLPDVVYERARRNFRTLKTGTQFLDERMEKVTGPVTKVYR